LGQWHTCYRLRRGWRAAESYAGAFQRRLNQPGSPSGFTFSHKVAGSFNAPLFLTVDDQLLAIPSAADAGSSFGYVTVIDLTGHSSAVNLSAGLEHPVGASFGPDPGS
jgi:hypothetical protein